MQEEQQHILICGFIVSRWVQIYFILRYSRNILVAIKAGVVSTPPENKPGQNCCCEVARNAARVAAGGKP